MFIKKSYGDFVKWKAKMRGTKFLPNGWPWEHSGFLWHSMDVLQGNQCILGAVWNDDCSPVVFSNELVESNGS